MVPPTSTPTAPAPLSLDTIPRVEQQIRHFVAAGLPADTIGSLVNTHLRPAVVEMQRWTYQMQPLVEKEEIPTALAQYVTAVRRGTAADRRVAFDAIVRFARMPDPTRLTPLDRTPYEDHRAMVIARLPQIAAYQTASELGVVDAIRPVQGRPAMTETQLGQHVSQVITGTPFSAATSAITALWRRMGGALTLNEDLKPSLVDCAATALVRRAKTVLAEQARLEQGGGVVLIHDWMEYHLPSVAGVPSPAMYRQRVDDLLHLETTIARVAMEERLYARTLGLQPQVMPDLRRAPLADVGMMTAYQRVRAHADPFVVFTQTLVSTGGEGRDLIARAIEVAITRRVEALLTDTIADRGTLIPRAIGWDMDPRHWTNLQEAYKERTTIAYLNHLRDQLGRDDPEYSRIEIAATRLEESRLLLMALSSFRPVAAGVHPTPAETWSDEQAKLATYAFQETEGQTPAVNSDGEVVDWHVLLGRHPHVGGTPPGVVEVSWNVVAPPLPRALEA